MMPFTLAHAWTAPGDMAALRLCQATLRARGIALASAYDGRADALKMHGMPLREAHAAAGRLADLTDAAREARWAEWLPPSIQRYMRRGDAWFGIPLGVHETNLVWRNASLARDAALPRLEVMADIERWLRAARRHVAAPLAVGAQPWQIGILFESLVLAHAGAEGYRAVFESLDGDWRHPALTEAVARFLALREFVDEGALALDWRDQLERVRRGDAALAFMGDWVWRDAHGLVGCRVPGTQVGITAVDFLVPLADADPDVAHAAARALTDPVFQARFAEAKGCVPAVREPGVRTASVPSIALEQSCAVAQREKILAIAARHFVSGAPTPQCVASLASAATVETLLVERSNKTEHSTQVRVGPESRLFFWPRIGTFQFSRNRVDRR